MISVWPDDLPCLALRDGYSETLPDGRLSTSMENGPPKVRRRFSSQAVPLPVQFFLTVDQKARLSRFWNEETGGGALPFWFRDQSQDGFPLATDTGATLCADDGTPLVMEAWLLVMFDKNAPTFARKGPSNYLATVSLVIMP